MSSHQTLSERDSATTEVLQPSRAVATEATQASSSAALRTASVTRREEVTTMAQRLRSMFFGRLDEVRIDAHRASVERTLVLSRPIL